MKKFIISEEEKSRILGMHQEATKRHYLGEQEVDTTQPTFVDNQGVKYFVPNLDQSKFSDFIYLSEKDDFMGKLNMLSSLGVKVGIQNNPIAVGAEVIKNELNRYMVNLKSTQGDTVAALEGPTHRDLIYLSAINTIENSLATAIQTYLKRWRPNSQGMNLINNIAFQNDPKIKNVKRIIPNIEEVLPKVLDMKSKKTGVNVV